MSSTESQPRSSVDLGVGSPCNNPEVKARNHPPRLQHSPSLPNIWFPPHSGPIPPQFEEITREPLRRLSTPPRPDAVRVKLVTSSLGKPSTDKDLNHHRESLSFDNAQTRPLKISMRRRADHEQGHTNSLLTPPLTPSSSLKTALSSDSAVQVDVSSECTRENYGDEADCKSTRFLLLGNVSRQIAHEMLRASIVEALTSPRAGTQTPPKNLSIPRCNANNGILSEDSIKGIFLRCQQSNGIAMLAFFDVRHAEIAKTIIATPSTVPLSQCVGDDLAEDGTRAWITCQFISAEELAEVIGSSPFLTSTDASFSLAVEGRTLTDLDDERQLRVVADYSSEDDNVGLTTAVTDQESSDLNVGMLKRFLKSFGGLRFFSAVKDMDNQKQHQNETIFHIEYYDVRAATSAYAAVDKQTLFGMKLRVFGRADLADSLSVNRRLQEYPCAQDATPNPYVAEQNGIVFPASSTENHDELPAQFGYPGQFSHTRERFFVEGPQAQMPTSTSIQGQEAFTNSGSPIPSPTYFYTSDATTDVPLASLPSDDLGRSGSEEAFYNTPTLSDGRPWFWDTGAQFHSAPGLYPHHDCYYCPSQGSPATSPASNYYIPCSTPSPYCYQQGQQTPPQNVLFPAVHPYGYQYDNTYLQPLTPTMSPNPANLFEHAMMTVPHPHVGDLWYPETSVSPGTQNTSYHGPQPSMAGFPNKYDYRTLPELAGDVYRPNLPPTIGSSYHRLTRPTSLRENSGSAKEPRPSAEHNQLNISKIEDGQDTRTTVMIKNIPNKMSDKDLVAFIGKVCPRRIDFLYLRMDFQNGCNVGYAFVNFITVQDLLTFAKKRLGQKWNMFSSEKVLQMSYANYQGKEALVEKFKNSCIMDEQEAWRPKIFYSDPGPEQGLPEPFPAPTHIRRKERSAFNRGALFVPGIGRGSMPPGSIVQTRRLEDTRKATDRHGQSSHPGSYTPGNSRRRSNTKSWESSQHE